MTEREVALGVTVFKRTEKLRQLLHSVEDSLVDTVYVADDGDASERESLYAEPFDFELEVIDLEYDAGLGRGRREITDRFEENYLLIVDNDHRLPSNLHVLVDVLESDPGLGGVGGLFLERGHLSGMCHDIYEEGDLLVRDTPADKPVEYVEGNPVVQFDFIPNVAVFRRECLDDYTWDPEYVIGKEHLDFYVGHKRRTDWRFAVCPTVLFPHDPGGDADFLETRHDPSRLLGSKEYFLRKWSYSQVHRRNYWLDLAHRRPPMMAMAERLPRSVRPAFLNLNDRLWRIKGKALDAVGALIG